MLLGEPIEFHYEHYCIEKSFCSCHIQNKKGRKFHDSFKTRKVESFMHNIDKRIFTDTIIERQSQHINSK